MKTLTLVAGILACAYLGVEGYAWHWNPLLVAACWIAFVLLLLSGIWKLADL